MKIRRRDFIAVSTTGIVSVCIGPLAWASNDEVVALLAKAQKQIMEADNRDKLIELIGTYESVIKIDPENYEALWSLGRYYGLLALAYTTGVNKRETFCLKALAYSERGLRTNPEFDALLAKGEKVWNACGVIGKREIAALFYWYINRAAIWNFCRTRFQQITGIRTLTTSKKIMTRMMEIDPEWAGGHPYFAWAVYYTALPRAFGGDLEKAEHYYDKAIESGPNWLYIKFGRAEYFHVKTNNRRGFIQDLEWVVARDPKTADSPYPANVYFQRRAAELLSNVDEYFKK